MHCIDFPIEITSKFTTLNEDGSIFGGIDEVLSARPSARLTARKASIKPKLEIRSGSKLNLAKDKPLADELSKINCDKGGAKLDYVGSLVECRLYSVFVYS